MSAAGLRLRLCPFCGSEPTLILSGACHVVQCPECKASGPSGIVFDFINSEDSAYMKWEEAEMMATGAAVRGWNCRPWIGSFYPDEEEEMRKGFRIDENTV